MASLPWGLTASTLPPHGAKAGLPSQGLSSSAQILSRLPLLFQVAPKILLLTLPCSILTSAMLPFLESCVPFILLRTQLPCLLLQEAGTCPELLQTCIPNTIS